MLSYSTLFGFSGASMIFGYLLYVVFGQITVRKLRKNPETKGHLGMTFINGSDIYNVSAIFSYPRFFLKRLEKGQKHYGNSTMVANKDVLLKHTNLFDRILGRIVFWQIHLSVVFMFIFAILNQTSS